MASKVQAIRYHDISVGHRVVGHENKCRYLHGHNYRIWFHCEGRLDSVGRVLDFGVIKSRLCQWLEEHWDHKMLLWDRDDLAPILINANVLLEQSVYIVPFNPTAECMAEYLCRFMAPEKLVGTGVICTKVIVEETRKCSALFELTGE